MNISEELRKLVELYQQGHLTEEEFAAAKGRILDKGRTHPPVSQDDIGTPPEAGSIEEKSYRSSRWSSGNLFFPDTLTLAGDGMVFRKGALLGSSEEHISYRAIASVRVRNGIFLADICIETSGGSQPIYINGIWKSDAREIQDNIRALQRRG